VCRQHKGECVHAACQCVKFDAVMIWCCAPLPLCYGSHSADVIM